jgi:beta-1,4-N-acetylglucosaminyltransferase
MFKFVSTLDWRIFRRVTYVVADTDKDSAGKAEDFMRSLAQPPLFKIIKIPRSREVGQSYLSSIFTTIKAGLFSVKLMLQSRPDLVRYENQKTLISKCCTKLTFSQLRFFPMVQEHVFQSVHSASCSRFVSGDFNLARNISEHLET